MLLRKVNVDRYDDREIVQTNLIESYDALMAFARKHLPDKFFLEDDKRVSLRNVIAREMISNVLMHREFTSSYMARFVIEKNRMYVENANRASGADCITPENLAPNPKNPIIASFFRTIGLADGLGSGTRNLFHYTKYYSGKEPELKEGDVFRIIVPLDDDYSYDYSLKNVTQKVEEKAAEVGLQTENVGGKVGEKTVDGSNKTPEVQDTHQDVRQDTRKNTVTLSTDNNNVITDNDSLDTDNNGKVTDNNDNNTDNGCRKAIKNSSLTDRQKMAVSLICENPAITVKEIAVKMDISWSSAHDLIKALCSKGCIARIGAKRNGHWELINR